MAKLNAVLSRRTANGALLALLLMGVCGTALSSAVTHTISESFTLAKGYTEYDGVTYDIAGMEAASGHVTVNLLDSQVSGGGLTFASFASAPASSVYSLNLSVVNTQVTNSTITLSGYPPRYSFFYFVNTDATMEGTTPLFVLSSFGESYNVSVGIVDTVVSWNPLSGVGGDVLQLASGSLNPEWYCNLFVTRANATNAAHIFNFNGYATSLSYSINIALYSMFAFDYVRCIDCSGAFVHSSSSYVPPLAGSFPVYVRFSNCTQTGGAPFYSASSEILFSFGADQANLVFSGISTDGPLFQVLSGGKMQMTYNTTLVLMHINAASSGLDSSTLLPYYPTTSTVTDLHVFMGNITFGGTYPTSATDYDNAFLKPKYIVDNFSSFVAYGTQHTASSTRGDYVYSPGEYTAAFCAMGRGTASVGAETLGDTAGGGGVSWTRAKCECASGFWAPYCTYTFDPILFYAGYTYAPLVCAAGRCEKCWWGETLKCSLCGDGYVLNATSWECVTKPVCGGNEKTSEDGISCVPMTCNAANCSVCVAEQDSVCQTCNTAYKLDTDGISCTPMVCQAEHCSECVYNSETKCVTCAANYKRGSDNTTCVAMTCSVAHCDICATEEEAVCQTCEANYILASEGRACTEMVCGVANCSKCAHNSSDACAVCDGNFQLYSDNASCIPMACKVPNCNVCVTEEDSNCEACGSGYELKAGDCVARKSSSGLGSGAIAGIVVGIVGALLLLLLILLLILCCRKKARRIRAHENVPPVQRDLTHEEMVQKPNAEEWEDMDRATRLTPTNGAEQQNPLLPTPPPQPAGERVGDEAQEAARSVRTGRRSRRTVHTTATFQDVNVEAMYSAENEIVE